MYWKRRRTNRSDLSGGSSARRAALWFTLLIPGMVGKAADKVQELQDHFDRETRAAPKVRILEKLGAAQFEAVGKAVSSGNFSAVGLLFEKYRDNAQNAFDLVKKQEPDAERHPTTYRHLELQVRQAIREVEEAYQVAPSDMRPPLELVHRDLLIMDDELIRLLFPRHAKGTEQIPAPEEAGR